MYCCCLITKLCPILCDPQKMIKKKKLGKDPGIQECVSTYKRVCYVLRQATQLGDD